MVKQTLFHENIKDICNICQKQFSSGLLRHMEIDHEGKRFHCEYCDHQSTQRSSLKMHIEAKHKGIKHICNQCGKSFSQSGTLNIHIKTKHKNSWCITVLLSLVMKWDGPHNSPATAATYISRETQNAFDIFSWTREIWNFFRCNYFSFIKNIDDG